MLSEADHIREEGPHFAWTRMRPAWRTIASCYPPIDLFEDIADPNDWEALIALEMVTNPRIRQETGDITLVPPERAISGPGASIVMAAFTHPNPNGGRFTDGTFGAYYASASLQTSLIERVALLEAHLATSHHERDQMDQRVYLGAVEGQMAYMLDRAAPELSRDSYRASQTFARQVKAAGGDGIVYPSLRHKDGFNIAIFWPDRVEIPIMERHIQFHYDGKRISRYFDFHEHRWIPL